MKFYPSKNYPTDVKVIHQGVDTLVTAHIPLNDTDYATKFRKFKYLLDDLKQDAQEVVSFSQDLRFVTHMFEKFGKFQVFAQSTAGYKYKLQNEDVIIWVGDFQYGANDFNTAHVRVEYRAHYLFSQGHKKAYQQVLQFISHYVGDTKNLCQRIDLATDVQGIKYTSFDKYRFQTNYNKSEFKEQKEYHIENTAFREYLRNNKTTGFHIGNGDFLFRIYDKTLEIQSKYSKSFITTKWILNGYKMDSKLPVWRHEIQYRRSELKKYTPNKCEDENLYHFSQLDKLWNNCINKVRWTDLTNDEIIRISENELKSDSIRKIFQRARTNPNRVDFWAVLDNWDNKLSSQIVQYEKVKEPQIKTAEKFYKAYLGATYRALGNDPQNLLKIHDSVETHIKELHNISLQEYAELRVMDSFIKNAKMIDKYGFTVQTNYKQVAFHYFDQLKQRLQNIDNKEMDIASRYFDHIGVENAS